MAPSCLILYTIFYLTCVLVTMDAFYLQQLECVAPSGESRSISSSPRVPGRHSNFHSVGITVLAVQGRSVLAQLLSWWWDQQQWMQSCRCQVIRSHWTSPWWVCPEKFTLNDRPTRKCLCGWSTALLANVQTHQGTCVKSHGPNQLWFQTTSCYWRRVVKLSMKGFCAAFSWLQFVMVQFLGGCWFL